MLNQNPKADIFKFSNKFLVKFIFSVLNSFTEGFFFPINRKQTKVYEHTVWL